MANSYLTHTQSAGTSTRKFTYSVWMKRSSISTSGSYNSGFFNCWGDANNRLGLYFYDNKLYLYGVTGGSANISVRTNRLFRDTSAWYHIVLAVDTTQGTAADRIKIYVNGVQETSLDQTTYPAQNFDFPTVGVNAKAIEIGRVNFGDQSTYYYMDGYLSHAAFVDGQQLAPTVFGETDSTSGIWKFKSPTGVTWGTNGFHLKFENSGALGTDSSGQSNTFAVNGNLKQSLDTPSTNYATLNPNDIMKQSGGIYVPTFSNGNLTMSAPTDHNYQTFGTLSPETGKWYYEMKIDAAPAAGHRIGVFFGNDKTHSGSYYYGSNAFYIHQNGQIYYNGSNTVYMSSYTAGDIISVALDVTNGNIYMSKNGGASDSTWADGSGNNNQAFPGTSINGKLSASWISGAATPLFDNYGNGDKQSINFGNGFFGTTAITSAGSNGNESLFEYDVPSGYYALNTKNINTYG